MQVQGLLRNEEQQRVLTDVRATTDGEGFAQMKKALRHHRREDVWVNVIWYGHHGTAVISTKLSDDNYVLHYVAPTTNDIELMSVMAAVSCRKQGKFMVDNTDPELEHKLRRKAATLRTEGALAVARSYAAAADLITGKW